MDRAALLLQLFPRIRGELAEGMRRLVHLVALGVCAMNIGEVEHPRQVLVHRFGRQFLGRRQWVERERLQQPVLVALPLGQVLFAHHAVAVIAPVRFAPNAPSGSGRSGRTAVFKFYGLRDNLT